MKEMKACIVNGERGTQGFSAQLGNGSTKEVRQSAVDF